MTRGKQVQTGAVDCLMGDYGFPEDFDFTFWDQPEDYRPAKVKPSQASTQMKKEPHPWLQFGNADKYERIGYLNRLAIIQDYPIEPSRIIEWNLLARLGVKDEFEEMMRTAAIRGGTLKYNDLDMWGRIFKLNFPIHREWCLEFYSTLQVGEINRPSDILGKQIIHFRLGGLERHCTVKGFAYLTGMMERKELMEQWGHNFLNKAQFDTSCFSDDVTFDQYWFQISGHPRHTASGSKASQIRSKKLRLLHKMITYSFLHRGDNNDKVYPEDLWLLRHFHQMGPLTYPLAPYILARHMYRHKEKRILCGHFISKIVRRLGVARRAESSKFLSNPIPTSCLGELDLVKAGLLTADRSRLLEENEAPPPPRRRRRVEVVEPEDEEMPEAQQPPEHPMQGPPGFDFAAMSATLHDIRGAQRSFHERYEQDQRWIGSHLGYLEYHTHRYQPQWESMFMGQPYQPPQPVPDYRPPNIFIPIQRRGGFWYPPQEQQMPHDVGGSGAGHPVHFGSFAGTAGASGSGSGDPGHDFVDDIFGSGAPQGGDGAPSSFGPPP